MASENGQDSCETSADIADEIRRAVESMGDEMPYTVSAGTMRRVADRIKAACEREREAARAYWTKKCRDTIAEHDRYCSPVGNAAAMREACENIAGYARTARCHTEDGHVIGYLDQIEKWARRAISAPARNCDVMSRSICTKHFSTIYEGNCDGLCDVQTEREKNIHLYYKELIDWLFAPAAERKGEGDGRK